MSTFNDREQQTIKEHCGDWVLYSVDELEQQLAAERAKVAQLERQLTRLADCGDWALCDVRRVARQALAALQSTDALADIKRTIFEEWCDLVCQEHPWIDRKRMQDAIRAKFGVTE